VVVAEKENLRIRVSGIVQAGLNDLKQRKHISKQAAIEGILTWFLEQDGMLQSLILGQIEEQHKSQAARMVLAKLTPAESSPTPKNHGEQRSSYRPM